MKQTTRQELDKLTPQQIVDYLNGREDVVWATYQSPDDFAYILNETLSRNKSISYEVADKMYDLTWDNWNSLYKGANIDLKRQAYEFLEDQYGYYFLDTQEGYDWGYSEQGIETFFDIKDDTLPEILEYLFGVE